MVTLISSPSCQPCRISKRILSEMNIDFVERNVADDPGALDLAKSLGFSATPVILLESGESWQGLDVDRLKALAS